MLCSGGLSGLGGLMFGGGDLTAHGAVDGEERGTFVSFFCVFITANTCFVYKLIVFFNQSIFYLKTFSCRIMYINYLLNVIFVETMLVPIIFCVSRITNWTNLSLSPSVFLSVCFQYNLSPPISGEAPKSHSLERKQQEPIVLTKWRHSTYVLDISDKVCVYVVKHKQIFFSTTRAQNNLHSSFFFVQYMSS